MSNLTSDELDDLKADLSDAQKEIARLEKELEEAYDRQGEPELKDEASTDAYLQRISELEDSLTGWQRKAGMSEDALAKEKQLRLTDHNDMLRALALVEIIHLNRESNWHFFSTTQGQSSLSWCHEKYLQEMQTFLRK